MCHKQISAVSNVQSKMLIQNKKNLVPDFCGIPLFGIYNTRNLVIVGTFTAYCFSAVFN